jgi:hypothetical protein
MCDYEANIAFLIEARVELQHSWILLSRTSFVSEGRTNLDALPDAFQGESLEN